MTIPEMEDMLVAALKVVQTDYVVEIFPEDIKNYEFTASSGAVLLKWVDSRHERDGTSIQKVEHFFEVITITRSHTTNVEALAAVALNKKTVTAMGLTERDRFECVDEDMLGVVDGYWVFGQKFSCRATYRKGT